MARAGDARAVDDARARHDRAERSLVQAGYFSAMMPHASVSSEAPARGVERLGAGRIVVQRVVGDLGEEGRRWRADVGDRGGQGWVES